MFVINQSPILETFYSLWLLEYPVSDGKAAELEAWSTPSLLLLQGHSDPEW